MTDASDTPRVPPDGRAWKDAQEAVADRNAEARKTGKAERQARERQVAQMRRAEERRGDVYR
jgi:hypothetical protein